MSFVGRTLEDARTGLRAHVISADEEHGRSFELEYTAPAGSPEELVMPHRHDSWTERFEVLEGRARYRLGRERVDLAAGEAVELPPGIVHAHPWNAGSTTVRIRQTTTLHRPDPLAVREVLESFAMLFWLASEGKVDAKGRPSPLQGAMIVQVLQRHGGSFPGPPVVVQKAMINALAALGRRRGYVAFDPAALGARSLQGE